MLRKLNQNGNCLEESFLSSIRIAVLLTLTGNEDIVAGFPNQSMSVAILEILPVTTATVARTFSSIKLIKTRV